MKDYFLRLYTYNHWANDRYFQLFDRQSEIPDRVHLLMSHVLVAQKLWLSRIKGNPDLSLHIWKPLPIDELKAMAVENTKNWLAYLSESDQSEFDRMMSYQNFQKIDYTNRVSDIIIHTANHATYHRAQFAVMFRQIGIDPPNTDFITFAREFSGELNLD
ncbi:DinB family protein [Rhodoflexus caldus]|uniref:DinB family protein n=1 Tax=Rhodoflexus caldus TaxID=2891236 RepID=UPI00202A1657|nr:DinB family protein [Rhodoflexus caldus]